MTRIFQDFREAQQELEEGSPIFSENRREGEEGDDTEKNSTSTTNETNRTDRKTEEGKDPGGMIRGRYES